MNVKSLYRLAEDAPLQKIDLRIVAAVCQIFGLALGDLIGLEKPKSEFRRLAPKAQARLAAPKKARRRKRTVAAA